MEKKLTQECCELYWTSPGSNTPQKQQLCGHTTTNHEKLSKLDEPDMWDTAGEVKTNS